MFWVFFHNAFVDFFLGQLEGIDLVLMLADAVRLFGHFEALQHLDGLLSLERLDLILNTLEVGHLIDAHLFEKLKGLLLLNEDVLPVAALMKLL